MFGIVWPTLMWNLLWSPEKAVTKEISADSFFNFFTPLDVPEDPKAEPSLPSTLMSGSPSRRKLLPELSFILLVIYLRKDGLLSMKPRFQTSPFPMGI